MRNGMVELWDLYNWSIQIWCSNLVTVVLHDDVMTWKSFLHYWPFVRDINWWLMDSPPLITDRLPSQKASDAQIWCILYNRKGCILKRLPSIAFLWCKTPEVSLNIKMLSYHCRPGHTRLIACLTSYHCKPGDTWPVASLAPSHHLNQFWITVNLTLK